MSEKVHEISKLREKLFETIDGLLDKEKPLEISRAKAVADVAQVLVDSAKAETAHLAVVGGLQGSGFIPDGKPGLPAPAAGKTGVIEHKK